MTTRTAHIASLASALKPGVIPSTEKNYVHGTGSKQKPTRSSRIHTRGDGDGGVVTMAESYRYAVSSILKTLALGTAASKSCGESLVIHDNAEQKLCALCHALEYRGRSAGDLNSLNVHRSH